MSVVESVGRAVSVPLDAAAGLTRSMALTVGRPAAATAMAFRSSVGGYVIWGRSRFNYQKEVGDPYGNSVVVAVIGWVARNFPEAPVKVVRTATRTKPQEDVPAAATGPGFMLRLLERPNDWYSGVLQWMATIVDLYCRGNAYWIKVRNESGRVIALWWVPEALMNPVGTESVFITHYTYTVDGHEYWLRPEDVIHFRDGIDPKNPRKGLSRLASLFREIFTDEEASAMTAALMRNLGVPGVVMAPANTTGPTGRFADPEGTKRNFMDKFGGDKRGEPLIMTVPTDIKVLSWSPEQMNLRDLRKIPEERISAVVGVAAIVAGLGAGLDRSTFSNFGEARKAAYQEAIIPGQRLIAAELEVQLLPEFSGSPDTLDVLFDWSVASAMQESMDAVWKRNLDGLKAGGITRADFKRAVKLPVADGGGDDVYVMANNIITVPVDTPNDYLLPTDPKDTPEPPPQLPPDPNAPPDQPPAEDGPPDQPVGLAESV